MDETAARANPQDWRRVADRARLADKGRLVVRVADKQIALFLAESRVHACNNRCPHEGYPLVEGDLADGCVLTCNWHNWKFDLSDGRTLVGGDALRVYPARLDGDDVLVDVADPPGAEVAARALEGLRDSFDRHEHDRMAREIARLAKAGGDPLEALCRTILWTHDRFEYGTTHAVPGAADWLALRDTAANDLARALTAVTEAVAHFAWDSRRAPSCPFPDGRTAYDAEALVGAIEAEDEAAAVALARGALGAGGGWAALEPALARVALAHYQDFGHALIYVTKTGELIRRLDGPAEVVEALAGC